MKIDNVVIGLLMAFVQSFAATAVSFKQIDEYDKNLKSSKTKFFLLMWAYCILVFYAIPHQLRFLLSIFTISIFITFLLKNKYIKSLVIALSTEILLSISEIIISIILVIVGLNPSSIVEVPFYNLIANICISLFAVILVYIPFINKKLLTINSLANKNKRFTTSLFIILITIYIVVAKNGLEFALKSNYYVNVLFIFVVVIIFTFIMKNEFKYNELEESNKSMFNYVTKYEKIITEQGKRNHEFKNQLMVIRGYAQMNSPKLLEYIDSLSADTSKGQSSFLISQLNKFPEGGIKGLLYYKLSIIEEEKINYEITVQTGVKTSLNNLKTHDYVNITKVLGVLLDNAIDASIKSKEKMIVINVFKEKGYVNFKIYNTYKGNIDLSKIGTGYSNKGKNHGYGLRLVNDIISSDNNLSLSNELEDNYYISNFKIKVSKIKNTK